MYAAVITKNQFGNYEGRLMVAVPTGSHDYALQPIAATTTSFVELEQARALMRATVRGKEHMIKLFEHPIPHAPENCWVMMSHVWRYNRRFFRRTIH